MIYLKKQLPFFYWPSPAQTSLEDGLPCQAAPELMLDRLGFFWQSYHLLDNSSSHIAELKCLKYFKIEFETTTQKITSMKVDDPDLDSFESASTATSAQLQARELGKIEAFIPIFDSCT